MPTTGPGTAGVLARRAIQTGADLIIVAGGDGTINEAMNGMVHSSVPLAVLPGGTANVLAMELGLGRQMDRVAGLISEGVPMRIAVGLLRATHAEGSAAVLSPRHFLLMAGVGLDAHIVYNVNLGLKAKLGKFAYWVQGFGQVGRQLEEFDVRVADHRFRCSFALASRVRNYGGDLEIARTTHLLDDKFEIVLFEGSAAYRYLKYFAGVLTGNLARLKGVSVFRAAGLEVAHPSDSRVYVQVDGEYAGRLPASVEIVPDALTLLTPPGYIEKFQALTHGSTPASLAG